MKNKFILWLSLLIAFSVTFHSCRTDLEATGKHNEEKVGEHIHQKVSTGTFQKETFLSGVNEFKRSNSSLSSRNSSGSDYLKGFFIDETSIYKMDMNNTQTYALRAYNIFESPETVYNLVYRKKGNDVAFSIVKILDNELIPVYDSQKGTVTKIDNPSTARTCTDFYSIELWHCKEGVSWSQCDKCSNCLSYSSGYTSYECGGGGGGSTGEGGSSPGGGDTGGGGGGSGLYDPSGYIIDPNITPSIEPSYVRAARASSFFYSQTDQTKSWAVEHADIYCNLLEYYLDNIPPSSPPPNSYYQDFANFSIQLFMQVPELTWDEFWYNKYGNMLNSSVDMGGNAAGNYDESTYADFDFENQQTQWPTINPVIPISDFVGWGASGVRRNCMDYAKAQIAKKGYKVSNYYDVDSHGNKQTFQVYTEQNGVNLNDLYKGVSYLKYALSNGIPVIVGIDDKTGHPGNLDNSTDHFVVIVGMGTDSKGRYFRFYDNAAGDVNQGTNSENKLYIKYPERIFTGQTQCVGYRAGTEYDYIMTMIRKSK